MLEPFHSEQAQLQLLIAKHLSPSVRYKAGFADLSTELDMSVCASGAEQADVRIHLVTSQAYQLPHWS